MATTRPAGRFRLRFERPPLVEAVCEFRFTDSSGWDWTVPGRLHERIRNAFPTVRQIRPRVVVVGMEPAPPVSNVERLHFASADGTRLVQSGPNLLAINVLPPYPGWDQFCDLVLKIFGHHAKLVQAGPVARVGLRYINRIGLGGRDAADLLCVLPELRSFFDASPTSFFERYEIHYAEPPGALTYQAGDVAGPERALMIDLDFWRESLDEVSPDALRRWLTAAHDRIEEVFVRSLSEKARALLGMREEPS